jgi:hypothetical protein
MVSSTLLLLLVVVVVVAAAAAVVAAALCRTQRFQRAQEVFQRGHGAVLRNIGVEEQPAHKSHRVAGVAGESRHTTHALRQRDTQRRE